jgi:hypothetical protein
MSQECVRTGGGAAGLVLVDSESLTVACNCKDDFRLAGGRLFYGRQLFSTLALSPSYRYVYKEKLCPKIQIPLRIRQTLNNARS